MSAGLNSIMANGKHIKPVSVAFGYDNTSVHTVGFGADLPKLCLNALGLILLLAK